MRLSVALVTRNRPQSLRRCLESLRAQDADLWEVMLSDDSDPEFVEATRALAKEFAAQYRQGPRLGLYANRNVAATACTGTHVRTMDDDHTFPPGHFAACIEAIRESPSFVLTTGQRSFLRGEYFDECPTASQLHPAGVGGPVHDLRDNWAIADGSTIYPREVFARGLRMAEFRASYGSSYLEFGALLYRHGFHSRCIPGVLVDNHAEAHGEVRDDRESRLFASLCYNLRFRPDPLRVVRYVLPHLVRQPSLIPTLPALLRIIRERWSFPLSPAP